jgi:hypothetical protein
MDESDNNFFPRFDTAVKTAIDGRNSRRSRSRVGFFSEYVQICEVHGQKSLCAWILSLFAGLSQGQG